ncbi:unnamed protein product [Brassicogethes aeneus]|uniref:DAN domain-containing protein n=1 Tax=Brassicogethes aeneus TaxID=1431903 RepID=A0A9P0AW62_BRAAE|nr:unnamed protein product [Brassicogethes aeneus]
MSCYKLLHLSIFLIVGLKFTNSEREHKVHNIVLYPKKYSWCLTTPIQQIVASPGYESVTIDNNVCVGACYSYSIPKTQPAEPGEVIGPYCDSCQPAKIKCYHVNLKADAQNLDGPRTTQKRVQIIVDCACASCDVIRKDDCDISDENTVELPSNLFLNTTTKQDPEEVPELLKMQNGIYNKMKAHDQLKHKKIIDLYRRIEDGGNKVNNESFNELNEILHYKKVKDILNKNDDEEDDEDDSSEEDIIPLPDGAFEERNHYNIVTDPPVIHQTTEKVPEAPSLTPPSHHNHHHHHQLGEVQQVGETVEHLIKGPHGSMVLTPVEKLHIDSDALKNNDEGLVISYEDHHAKKPNHITVN